MPQRNERRGCGAALDASSACVAYKRVNSHEAALSESPASIWKGIIVSRVCLHKMRYMASSPAIALG